MNLQDLHKAVGLESLPAPDFDMAQEFDKQLVVEKQVFALAPEVSEKQVPVPAAADKQVFAFALVVESSVELAAGQVVPYTLAPVQECCISCKP